jgi:hypothetical protein
MRAHAFKWRRTSTPLRSPGGETGRLVGPLRERCDAVVVACAAVPHFDERRRRKEAAAMVRREFPVTSNESARAVAPALSAEGRWRRYGPAPVT